MNLYRQAHVIEGGLPILNQVFLDEADEDVLSELEKLPNGKKLVQHIKNLKSGKTPMNDIDRGLIPYGGMMCPMVKVTQISDSDLKELQNALADFQPDEEHIEKIKNLKYVNSFGENWVNGVSGALADKPELAKKWHEVTQTARAYDLWNRAYAALASPVSEMERAKIQADLSEYETYLPMFGADGEKLMTRLRTFVSSV